MYALKNFFIIAKLFTCPELFDGFRKYSSKRYVCSIIILSRSPRPDFFEFPRPDFWANNHGFPKMASHIITPSKLFSFAFFFASTKSVTPPFPIASVLVSLRIPAILWANSQWAGTFDISFRVRKCTAIDAGLVSISALIQFSHSPSDEYPRRVLTDT